MMLTLGSDPDTHHPAIAVVQDGSLVWYWQGDVPKALKGDDAVAESLRQLHGLSAGQRHFDLDVIAVEQMQVYPGNGEQGADTIGKKGIDGLMRVASVGGGILSWALPRWPDARYAMPTAEVWKGQRSKAADHRQSLRKLQDNETKDRLLALPKTRRSHVLDAVGIALWAQSYSFQKREAKKDLMARAKKLARKAKG